jgi:hypothetical protein
MPQWHDEEETFDDREFQFFDEDGNLTIAMHSIPSGLCP